jgi:glycosyltransferase involved in cell wall biosynthesis
MAWCGRLNPIKNLDPLLTILVRVKKKVPEAQLVVIGAGTQYEHLTNMARTLGLSVSEKAEASQADVIFVGFKPNPYRYMKACDLFVLTSRAEGLPLVIVEAMGAGLPVLASDCPAGGPHSIMDGMQPYQPGRSTAEETPYGYLLPVPETGNSSTEAIWEDAIVEMLTDEAKRARKSVDSMRRVANFSKDQVKKQWFELLDSV